MKRRTYPEYKDSCIEWLGEIPGHWEFNKPKQLEVEIASLLKGVAE